MSERYYEAYLSTYAQTRSGKQLSKNENDIDFAHRDRQLRLIPFDEEDFAAAALGVDDAQQQKAPRSRENLDLSLDKLIPSNESEKISGQETIQASNASHL